jgi:hypothetical protein
MTDTMSASSATLTSAGGILSLLDEEDATLQQFALQQLNSLVHQFWPEIATAIPRMSQQRAHTALSPLFSVSREPRSLCESLGCVCSETL